MISKLRFFGDSYVAPEFEGHIVGKERQGIALQLAEKMNLVHKNHAAHGSCLEFSVKNLLHRLDSGEIESGELIIFCITTSGRFALKSTCDINVTGHGRFPKLASGGSALLHYNLESDTLIHKGNVELDRYARENKEGLIHLIMEKDYFVDKIQHMGLMALLFGIAEKHQDKKFVFASVGRYDDDKKYLPKMPDNCIFFPVYMSEIDQAEAKWSAEIKNFMLRKNMPAHQLLTKYSGSDPRINHLTVPNMKIFVEDLFIGIQNWNFKHVRKSKYLNNHWHVPTTAEEYLKSVDAGEILYRKGYEIKYSK